MNPGAGRGSTEQDDKVASAEGYLLDNQQAEAGRRFTAMAELFDPVTIGNSAPPASALGGAAGRSEPADRGSLRG